MKPVETPSPETANNFVYLEGGRYTTVYLLSREPRTAPTVGIEYDTHDSLSDANGHFDRAFVSIYLRHFVTRREDRKHFYLYMEAGRAFNRPIWSGLEPVDFRSRSATIREWLTECETSHPNCQRFPKLEAQLATRILDIQEHETDRYSVNLVSTQGIDLYSRPYIVLTHVWGNIELPCKTTKSNISAYYDDGIDFDSLPKTFQDAVRLTVAIGFKYLWIDSLCIIQDDTEDWQRESAKMAAIYGAGTITLSATSAENSHGGFGLSPKIQSVTRFCSNYPGRPDFAVKEKDKRRHDWTDTIEMQLRDEPVRKRAWILQEQILSRRILHATYSEFVWECNSIKEREDGTAYDQKTYLPPDKAWRTKNRGFPQKMRDGGNGELDGFEFERRWWWDCVKDYMKRSLTRTSDQYAALAGIVQFHQDISGNRPIVGLWERHLALHLSWKVFHDPQEHKSPSDRDGPSWTWMSFPHGSVNISPPDWGEFVAEKPRVGDLGIVYQAEILNTDIKWSGEPLTSDPSGSTINIRGFMRRMRKPKPLRAAVYSRLRLDPGVTDEGGEAGEYDTFALFAYVRSAVLINLPPTITTAYLVVQAIGPEEEGLYRRIGEHALTVDFDMDGSPDYVPEGVQRDITLV
ncbi:heterokaryon incompatibility protein-domain-containing protein [Bipolaris maydis]|nr:heterokaryon incompatibility protein-domain-containing protein [Bipolaris maydis]